MTAAPRTIRLFTLRLWRETGDAASAEWRGKLQSLPDGEACYFHGWPGLIERLEEMLAVERAETTNSEPSIGGEP